MSSEEEEVQDESAFDFIRRLATEAEAKEGRAEIFSIFRFPDTEDHNENISEFHVLAMCNDDTCMHVAQVALTLMGKGILEQQGIKPEDFDKPEHIDSAAFLMGMKALARRGAEWAAELKMHEMADALAKSEEAEAEKKAGEHYSDTVEDTASGGDVRKPTHPGDNNVH